MTPRSRLAAAAVTSLALHALVVAGNWLPLPQLDDGLRQLEVRLAPRPELKPPPPPPPKVRPARRAAPRPAPPVATVAAVGPPPVAEPQPEAAPAEFAAPEAAAPKAAAPEPPQRLALAADSTATIARSLPRRGRITYSVLYGDSQTYVGQVVQTWQAEDGAYSLASEAETAGIVELFRPQRLRYVSQGRITPQGLQPERFLVSRTRRGRTEAAEARFDWAAHTLAYGEADEPHHVALPPGAQDFMSFVYQFVLVPPAPGRHRVAITTGSRFEVYEIEVSSETAIDTPIGTLKALPVRQVPRPGAESIEIWLAADYRYLPVRIRHFDRDGRFSGEQMVSEIRVSDDERP